MSNPKGNPDFGVKYKGKRKSDEPLSKKIYSIRLPHKVHEQLMSIPSELRQDLVREAIARVLAECPQA